MSPGASAPTEEDAKVRMWIAMPFAVGSRGIVLRSVAPWS
jgi:hypothetical protein